MAADDYFFLTFVPQRQHCDDSPEIGRMTYFDDPGVLRLILARLGITITGVQDFFFSFSSPQFAFHLLMGLFPLAYFASQMALVVHMNEI